MHLARELLTNGQGSSGDWRSFAMETRALKMRSIVANHHKLANCDQHHQSWSFYSYPRSCWRTLCQPFIQCLKLTGKGKKLSQWVPHELTTNQKNRRFEVSSSLILCDNNGPFLNQIVTCDEKDFISQLTMTGLVVGPRRGATGTSQSQTCTTKRSWSLFGGLMPVWSTTFS